MLHILFIYSSVSGHLGYFHLLAIVNSVAITLVIRKLQIINCWIVLRGKRKLRILLMGSLKKLKIEIPYNLNNPTPAYIHRKTTISYTFNELMSCSLPLPLPYLGKQTDTVLFLLNQSTYPVSTNHPQKKR